MKHESLKFMVCTSFTLLFLLHLFLTFYHLVIRPRGIVPRGLLWYLGGKKEG